MNKPRYSVIIPAYCSEATISGCLDSLMSQDLGKPFEILLVNSSQDSTPEIVRSRFPAVILLQQERQTDQGTARNLALEKASGEIIFFLDADCTVKPDWMSRMIDRHRQYPDLPGIGGPVRNADLDSPVGWAGYLMEFGELFPKGELRETWHLGGGNVSYKREFFDRGFRFPKKLKFALEDMIFNWNLRKKGVRFLFDPQITVIHYHRTDWKSFLRHQYKLGRGNVHLLHNTGMEGIWLVEHPWLSLLLMPLVGLLKFCRTLSISYRFKPDLLFRLPLIAGAVAMGVAGWCLGFSRELITGDLEKVHMEK